MPCCSRRMPFLLEDAGGGDVVGVAARGDASEPERVERRS